MSGRKLGGGRILGSGRGLAPPAPPAHQRRTSDLISPSESTLSLSSRDSSGLATSPLPDASQDLRAAVSLKNGGPVTAASSKLVCPICNEEMVSSVCFDYISLADFSNQMTLLQLNRYIIPPCIYMHQANIWKTSRRQSSGAPSC